MSVFKVYPVLIFRDDTSKLEETLFGVFDISSTTPRLVAGALFYNESSAEDYCAKLNASRNINAVPPPNSAVGSSMEKWDWRIRRMLLNADDHCYLFFVLMCQNNFTLYLCPDCLAYENLGDAQMHLDILLGRTPAPESKPKSTLG